MQRPLTCALRLVHRSHLLHPGFELLTENQSTNTSSQISPLISHVLCVFYYFSKNIWGSFTPNEIRKGYNRIIKSAKLNILQLFLKDSRSLTCLPDTTVILTRIGNFFSK